MTPVNFIDLTGQTFGRLFILHRDLTAKKWIVKWVCQCSCIGKTIRIVAGHDLRSGHTKSCGCLSKEISSKKNYKHGECSKRTRLYRTWANFKTRCLNINSEDYERYGGRGIIVCEEWKEYINFKTWAVKSGWQKDLELDRIDNNGNYCPENCRWTTRKTNVNNREKTIRGLIKGENLTLTEAVNKYNIISYYAAWTRLKSGNYSFEEAVLIPKGGKYKRFISLDI